MQIAEYECYIDVATRLRVRSRARVPNDRPCPNIKYKLLYYTDMYWLADSPDRTPDRTPTAISGSGPVHHKTFFWNEFANFRFLSRPPPRRVSIAKPRKLFCHFSLFIWRVVSSTKSETYRLAAKKRSDNKSGFSIFIISRAQRCTSIVLRCIFLYYYFSVSAFREYAFREVECPGLLVECLRRRA